MPEFPRVPLYLFYGNQTDAIFKARDAVLEMALPAEFRNENLTEYYPTAAGDTVKFAGLVDEIAGDMATLSFIPGADKVVIVTNPAEIYGKGGGKNAEKAEGRMLTWLSRDLPSSGHTLILIAMEDEAAQREVVQQSPLYQMVMKIGYLRGYSDTKAFFRIEDAIMRRQAPICIDAVRDLWKAGKGDMNVYSSVTRCLRYLLQANIARERKILKDATMLGALFPGEPSRNLFKASPNVQRKYLAGPVYRTADLVKAYQTLLDVYRALRPRPDDEYVPDAQGMLEQALVELMTSPRPKQA